MTFKKQNLIKKIKNFGQQHRDSILMQRRTYSCTFIKQTNDWLTSERAPQAALERCEQMLAEALSKVKPVKSKSLFDGEFVGESSTVSAQESVKVVKARVLKELEQKTTLVTEGVSGIGTNVVQEPQSESVQQALSEDLSFLDNAANSIAQHPDLTDLFITAFDKSSQM